MYIIRLWGILLFAYSSTVAICSPNPDYYYRNGHLVIEGQELTDVVLNAGKIWIKNGPGWEPLSLVNGSIQAPNERVFSQLGLLYDFARRALHWTHPISDRFLTQYEKRNQELAARTQFTSSDASLPQGHAGQVPSRPAAPPSRSAASSTPSNGLAGQSNASLVCQSTGPLSPNANLKNIPSQDLIKETEGGRSIDSNIGLPNLRIIAWDTAFLGKENRIPGSPYSVQFPTYSKPLRNQNGVQLYSTGIFSLKKNGVRNDLDVRPFLPIDADTSSSFVPGPSSVTVYGRENSSTGALEPKVFGLSVGETKKPAPTGIASVDGDRLAKFLGQRVTHDGDKLVSDSLDGDLVFVQRPENPFCIIGATLKTPPNTLLIQATGGSEYFFNLGPDQFPPQPRTDALKKAFKTSAESYINALVRDADNLPCLSREEAKKQLSSLPPGCGDGSRPRFF